MIKAAAEDEGREGKEDAVSRAGMNGMKTGGK
jgi:hypothetical protein